MTTDELILYFAVNAFDAEIIRRSMRIFFDRPRGRVLCAAAYFLNYAAALFSHSVDSEIIALVVDMITIGFIAAQYDGAVKRKIIAAAFAFALGTLCELAAGIIFAGNFTGNLVISGSPDLGALMISKLLNFAVVIIIKRKTGSSDKARYKAPDVSAAALIPISSAVLEVAVISSVQSMTVIILSVVIILFLNVIVFYLYDKLAENYARGMELEKAEQEKEMYYNQFAAMMRSRDSLRQFRHDIVNQLETVKILLNSGDIEELKHQVNELIEGGADSFSSFTGNAVTDGILNYKLEKLKQCGARTEISAEIPGQIFMSAKDLTLVLGNLLDNAIDALYAMRGDKYCFVGIKYSKSRLFICVKNTYENRIVYKNGAILSTKPDADAHGIGLRSVRDVVDKYNGSMDISHDGKLFSVKIILFLPLDGGSGE